MSDVYLDAYDAEEIPAEMFLHAVRVDGNWNGFPVPVVSAAEFQRFLGALVRNDPNSTFDPSAVIEGDGALVYEDECGREMWSVVGIEDGAAVYALDGWTWSL